jgi:16S rRNA (adenine1518-N6/adenine1519-N6)-dimethyltransferase
MRGHTARKRFGQNFLVDPHYVAKIVDAIDPRPGDNLVEIGPGLAALTGRLIERAGRIHAIEIDRDLASRLAADLPPDKLALHVADALEFDYASLGPRLRVVGNLPYNISSPLLFRLGELGTQLRDLHVMLQREVIARMTAQPATADYGRLSVMLQVNFRVTRLFVVPAGAFQPVPKVESAIARLVPLGDARPRVDDPALFPRRRRGVRPTAEDDAQRSVRHLRRRRAGSGRHRPRRARRDAPRRGFRPARQRAGREDRPMTTWRRRGGYSRYATTSISIFASTISFACVVERAGLFLGKYSA